VEERPGRWGGWKKGDQRGEECNDCKKDLLKGWDRVRVAMCS